MTIWRADAPSNIALIKYMGKSAGNIPLNRSLSYTLPHLRSFVELELYAGFEDVWHPLETTEHPCVLSLKGQQRFLAHLNKIKSKYDFTGQFIVRSANNFPMATGLASSASSFAALTQVAVNALTELTAQPAMSLSALAHLSQQGSGSSCRSFFSPWAMWDKQGAYAITAIPYPDLIHVAVVTSSEEKMVSSSSAHQLVQTSPLFINRLSQVEKRLENILIAFTKKNWRALYELVKEEFLEMHELFHTSEPSFRYITPQAEEVIRAIDAYWETHSDGPLITMDAGPNIHLLFRADQEAVLLHMKHTLLRSYHVL